MRKAFYILVFLALLQSMSEYTNAQDALAMQGKIREWNDDARSETIEADEILANLIPDITHYWSTSATMEPAMTHGEELSIDTLEGNESRNYDYVDLGLPSGLLWATCNVGAKAPEDFGDYFAWGETKPKERYSWYTYQHSKGGYYSLTKYCSNSKYGFKRVTDSLNILLPEDDAATTNWAGEWRMPTKEEWEELKNNTTCTWTTQNGVRGLLFTSANGNSLFLPAAGRYWKNFLKDAGSNGNYWSSSLNTKLQMGAWCLAFSSKECYVDELDRDNGYSVRPVRPKYLPGVSNNVYIEHPFSVSTSQQVYFSLGNLQFIGSDSIPYWKFADYQWEYLGCNGQNSSSPTADRDLFGWGTSSIEHGANNYQPWSTSTENSRYNPYNCNKCNLFDHLGKADWGFNKIGDDNQYNQWRTLTSDEWVYVLETRSTNSGIRFAMAKVNNVNGMVLLPDDWESSIYQLNDTNGGTYDSNTISAEDWMVTFETKGAIFLPAAGYRYGVSVDYVNRYGYYWSSSCSDNNYTNCISFGKDGLNSRSRIQRFYGFAVRLVRPVR